LTATLTDVSVCGPGRRNGGQQRPAEQHDEIGAVEQFASQCRLGSGNIDDHDVAARPSGVNGGNHRLRVPPCPTRSWLGRENRQPSIDMRQCLVQGVMAQAPADRAQIGCPGSVDVFDPEHQVNPGARLIWTDQQDSSTRI
jgi:hypothetical protein